MNRPPVARHSSSLFVSTAPAFHLGFSDFGKASVGGLAFGALVAGALHLLASGLGGVSWVVPNPTVKALVSGLVWLWLHFSYLLVQPGSRSAPKPL